ncbi:MAG: Ldh family oxidoreductase [Synergistaceae bacterium]|jgi:LDH2 family malate/lactate/ureidoglycolate dehydrogenase|nr:Ldh family oxidoreductase [Synergistaceae bacterium]
MEKRIGFEELKEFVTAALLKMGYSEKSAAITAVCLVEADARGIYSHGSAALNLYRTHTSPGGCIDINAAEPSVVFETPISAVLDGFNGVGFYIAEVCAGLCVEKAKQTGLSVVLARNANHYGFAGYWTELMAKSGLIGITCCNTVRCVCPTRSAERILGTNPIAAAFPLANGKIFMADMATSIIAQGKLNRSNSFGTEGVMRDGFIIDEQGNPVNSVKQALEIFANRDGNGGLFPIGGDEYHRGYKGFAISLIVELLTGGLTRGVSSKYIRTNTTGISLFFMAIDPGILGDKDTIAAHMEGMLSEYKNAKPIDPALPVLLPNEIETGHREDALKQGIPFSENVYKVLRDAAKQLGLEERLGKITIPAQF